MKNISLFTLCVFALVFSGCVSGVMTRATGKRLDIVEGTPRGEVIMLLGVPELRTYDISPDAIDYFARTRNPIVFAEVFKYRGKLNSPDEGTGQAMLGALTLGLSEIVMIPLTLIDIVERTKEINTIYVFFDRSELVVYFLVKSPEEHGETESLCTLVDLKKAEPGEGGNSE